MRNIRKNSSAAKVRWFKQWERLSSHYMSEYFLSGVSGIVVGYMKGHAERNNTWDRSQVGTYSRVLRTVDQQYNTRQYHHDWSKREKKKFSTGILWLPKSLWHGQTWLNNKSVSLDGNPWKSSKGPTKVNRRMADSTRSKIVER